MSISSIRNWRLDAIRGIAILGVIMVHVSNIYEERESLLLQSILSLGRYGVQLFFVISGFLMTQIVNEKAFSHVEFLKRRVIRLYPLWLLFLVVFLFANSISPIYLLPVLIIMLNTLSPQTCWLGYPGTWTIAAEFLHYIYFAFFGAKKILTR